MNADPTQVVSTEFVVDGMDCGDCARRMEERLARLTGIHATVGMPASRILRVEYDPAFVEPRQVSDELGKIGYMAVERDPGAAMGERIRVWRTRFAYRTYASGICFALGLALQWGGVVPGGWPLISLPSPLPSTPAHLLFLAAALVGGWNFFPVGIRAVMRVALDMHVLMMLAIIGALGIGEPLEAAAIAFLFSLAELLEQYAVRRAHDSVQALMSLSPERATVIRDGREVVVGADDVRPGEHLVLRTGERVPVDGTALEGQAAIDASAITGESIPIECEPGGALLSGMLVAAGYLVIRADRRRDDSALARIVRVVEEAQARKSPSERFVTRFARVYTPAVTIFAAIIVTVPTLLFGGPFELWFERALTLLVIACPCALVISTPVAVVSGLTAAARQGVLIKGGDALERLAAIRTIALDKTGTLTYGHPAVTDVEVWDGGAPDELLGRAAAAERQSEHPLARAIVRGARDRGIELEGYAVESFVATPGIGVRALVDGQTITIGNERTSESTPQRGNETEVQVHRLGELRSEGKTVLLVSEGERPAGLIALADRPRTESRRAVSMLARLGLRPVMLTGDNQATASQVAQALGIEEFHAELRPEEKLEWIERLERAGPTAMVGDGVNDAPALAAAGVGIALAAAGSDVALETADAALMGDQLERLPYMFRLSRASRNVIRQNVIASMVIKLSLAVAVPFGLVSLVAAVLVGDLGASLVVTANSLRLAGLRPRQGT